LAAYLVQAAFWICR